VKTISSAIKCLYNKHINTFMINLAPLAVFLIANTRLLTLFGYHVCGWFGLKRMLGSFTKKKLLLINC